MCGVAGFSLSPSERVNVKRLTRSLLLGIEERGKDATGFAFTDKTGQFQVHKYDTNATDFVRRRLCVPRSARTVICHTRFATQGTPLFNANNHPIATGPIVGVHNGMLWNDDSLFKRIENTVGQDVRIAEVDSEAAFAALGYLDQAVLEVLPQLRGSATLAWLDARDDNDTLHLARVESSPLIIGETKGGSVIFASTEKAVIGACRDNNLELVMLRDIPEGYYLTVTDGDYNDVRTFEVPKWVSYSTGVHTPARRGTYEHWNEMDDYEWYHSISGVRTRRDPHNDRNERPTPLLSLPAGSGSTGDNLRARLEAEVPDEVDTTGWTEEDLRTWHLDATMQDFEETGIMFTADGDYAMDDDPDDVLYDEWLRLNARGLDEAISLDDERDRRRSDTATNQHKQFAAYLSSPVVSTFYITDTKVGIAAPPNESAYLRDDRHIEREADVEKWGGAIRGDETAKSASLNALKAGARPGDFVTTEVNGTLCRGQIACMPSTFPAGEYILRVLMPNEKRDGSYEAAFIGRRCHEFEFDYAAFSRKYENVDDAEVIEMRPKADA